MKAITVSRYGGPEVLEYAETAPPKPAEGETIVETEFTGINFIDVYHRTGLYPLSLPFIPGVEAAGAVQGADRKSGLKEGQPVAYAGHIGSYAERCSVPSWKLVPLPDSISTEQAAALLLQGMTAHYLTHDCYRIKREDTVLVHAAAGGVGLLLAQIARLKGAEVIGTVSTGEKAAIAKKSGLSAAIIYTEADFEEETMKLTGGKGVDAVYDSVGNDTFSKSLDCLRTRGHMVSFGQSSGPVAQFNPLLLSGKSLTLIRPKLSDYVSTRDELLSRATWLFSRLESGEIKLNIHRKFRLHEAAEAHIMLESRETVGKLLLET